MKRPPGTVRAMGAIVVDDLRKTFPGSGRVRSLSLGQRMRCELVASMLHQPEVLFLDEPTIGLDLVAKSRFRDLIVRINEQRRTTILLTSHDVSDIEQVARRVIVINHGRLIYDDRVSVMRRALLGTK